MVGYLFSLQVWQIIAAIYMKVIVMELCFYDKHNTRSTGTLVIWLPRDQSRDFRTKYIVSLNVEGIMCYYALLIHCKQKSI